MEGEEEVPSVGVSFSQDSENGTELDVACTGSRTSTLITSWKVPLSSRVVMNCLSCWDLSPSAGKETVFQFPDSEPFSVTQRYVTVAGSRPTVSVAVKVGASEFEGGQVPE